MIKKQSSFKLKPYNYLCSAGSDQYSTNSYNHEDDGEEIYHESKNIPKMELLKMNYVQFTQDEHEQYQQQMEQYRNSIEQRKHNLTKYSVYKKYNGFGDIRYNGNTHCGSTVGGPKENSLKYQNDDENFVKQRRRLLLFETKTKNLKFDNIQFYFDNKSYEQYVDNKLYGFIGDDEHEGRKFDKKSNSWNYRKSSKGLKSNKLNYQNVPSKRPERTNSMSDVERISQIFLNARLENQKIIDHCICSSGEANEIVNSNNSPRRKPQDTTFDKNNEKINGKLKKMFENRPQTNPKQADSFMKNHPTLMIINEMEKLQSDIDTNDDDDDDDFDDDCSLDDSTRQTCGYKNCNFSICPISSNSSSASSTAGSSSCDEESVPSVKTYKTNNKLDHYVSSDKDFGSSCLINDISANQIDLMKKINNSNTCNNSNNTTKLFIISENDDKKLKQIEEHGDFQEIIANNLKNVNIKTKNKEKLLLNKNFNNLINNNKITTLKAQENCVKIFIPSPTSSTEMSPTVTVNHTKPTSISSYDSDLDYGYYEKIPEKVYPTAAGDPSFSGILSSSAIVSETIKSKTTEKLSSIIDVPIKLGCDGAIFWNNCYYYDDKYDCSQCCHIDIADQKNEKFVCVCGAEEIDGTESRPRSVEGSLDSGVLICGDNGSSPDSDNSSSNPQSQIDIESRKLKRGHVLAELLETERVYVAEMGSILKGYRDQMLSEELAPLVPPGLQGKEDVLFGNLHELYTFHSEIFLKDLENCISATELVALCFVQRRETFYRLYSYYCQNIPRSERLRETLVDTHLFLQECQKRLGHKLPLAAYLLKPVQRITKYQLLLKDLLRFSDNGACGRELQKALDCMLIVLKCVNDSMHQIAITGFPADLSQQGELLMQDSFQLWTDSKKDLRLRLKTQQRHIFLYQKALLFCKPASKTGHNKSTYQFKHFLKMSQIGLTESVRGDPKRFEIWLQGRQEVHTIQATTVEIKNKWVSEIKRVLLNQLEELKGEKIKQYGLNHKPLRQTASWDMPLTTHSAPYRTMSCDTSDTNVSNRNSIISEDIPLPITGISSSSSDHDNQSSDYSNSEDEFAAVEEAGTPGSRFISLADYCAMGHSEVSMKDGDTIELLKVGCAGWWFVKVLGSNLEGWAPAAYLEPVNKKSTRCSSRNQDRLTEH